MHIVKWCFCVIFLAACFVETAAAQCDPSWSTDLPMIADQVRDSIVFDDGSGAALYLAGDFELSGVGSGERVIRWDGTSLTAVGTFVFDDFVFDLEIADLGSGPELFAAGRFTGHIASWDGTSWTPFTDPGGVVQALEMHDAGLGPRLFAGGGVPGRIAVYDDVADTWSAVGGGVSSPVQSIESFQGDLYVSGLFECAGTVNSANCAVDGVANTLYVARWDGSDWQALGGGVTSGTRVGGLFAVDAGDGEKLYAVGQFDGVQDAGLTAVPGTLNIAAWDGTSWTGFDTGLGPATNQTFGVAAFDYGEGLALYVSGNFGTPSRVARWNGTNWEQPAQNLNGAVRTLTSFDDGSGIALFGAGLNMSSIEGVPISNFTKLQVDGDDCNANGIADSCDVLDSSFDCNGDGEVDSCQVLTSPELDCDGNLLVDSCEIADNPSLDLNGDGFLDSCQTINCTAGWVTDIPGVDDIPGPNLVGLDEPVWTAVDFGGDIFVGGDFSSVAGVPATRIARFDGTNWSQAGQGFDNMVLKLKVLDLGDGPELYAAGQFLNDASGLESLNKVARWNPDTELWEEVGTNGLGSGGTVWDLEVYAGELYAAGTFGQRIRKYDPVGDDWDALPGGGISDIVRALTIYDGQLIAAGDFTCAGDLDDLCLGGTSAFFVAAYDGATWSALGTGISGEFVLTAASIDLGSGEKLYVGGRFVTAGGNSAINVACWDGSDWSAVGDGLGDAATNNLVRSLIGFDPGVGDGPQIFATGGFGVSGATGGLGRIARFSETGGAWQAVEGGGLQAQGRSLSLRNVLGQRELLVAGDFLTAGDAVANTAQGLARYRATLGFGPDCNLNSAPDDCEIAGGYSEDCNSNGIPDDCDIADLTSVDCNLNGIPDSCEGVVAPVVITAPASVSECEDGVANFEVVADGVDLSYQWLRNGMPIMDETGSSLNLTDLTTADEGLYSVLVSNLCGTVESTGAMLDVFEDPEFTLQPVGGQLCFDDDWILSTTVTGDPTPDLQWYKDGVELPGEIGQSLVITDPTPADEGDYQLMASNVCSMISSSVATIEGLDPVTIVSDPMSDGLCIGQYYVLSVEATGSGELSYQWRLDGTVLPDESESSIIFTVFEESQAGDYTVTVSNDCGAVESEVATITSILADQCDCNDNGISDTLELGAGLIPDCNNNGIPDSCDIETGFSEDTNLNGVPDECDVNFLRADANNDLTLNIADVVYILNYIFLNGPDPECFRAADANGSQGLDLADSIFIINYLFTNGSAPPAPFPSCGTPASPSILSCVNSNCP